MHRINRGPFSETLFGPLTAADEAPVERAAEAPEVRVIRSANRKRSVSARMVGSVMELRIPSRMSAAEEAKWVREMSARFARQSVTKEIDLIDRCADLARRYDLQRPDTVRWVTNQEQRWGSCTPQDRSIRISDRLSKAPLWVLDYVLVHEMAHLRVANHSAEFWAIVSRYPKTERARGYLMALGDDDSDS